MSYSSQSLLIFCVFFALFSVLSAQSYGYFWHVTDFHWDLNYTQVGGDPSQMCWSSNNVDPQQDIGAYGNYACDSPWSLVISTLQFMSSKLPNPDFIVWTGDDDAHVSDDNFSPSKVLGIMANLTSAIQSYFPSSPVIPVFGNHDAYPKSNFPPESNSDMYVNVADLWRSWLGEAAYNSFKIGGYYWIPHPTIPNVIVVGLNTPVYYEKNYMVTTNDIDPLGQLTWLDQVLTNASANNQKAYIVAHIPPGMFGRKVTPAGQKWFRPRFNQIYLDLVVKHSSVILGQVYGHDHTDSFKLYYDSTGQPVNVHFAAPAVTPWNTTLAGIGPNNPGVRLFTYDKTTGQLINYEQYYLNLSVANQMKSANWALEYDFLSAYDLNDISPSSIDSKVATFATSDRTYFDKYYLFNSVSYAPASECDSTCQRNHYCSIVDVDYDAFVRCNNPQTNRAPHDEHRGEQTIDRFRQFVRNYWHFLRSIASRSRKGYVPWRNY